jgi:hypothetical protein
MSQKIEYKIICGNTQQVQSQLDVLASQDWTPILMSNTQTQGSPVAITILLEHVPSR